MTAIPPDRTEGEAGHIDDHHAVNAVLTEHAADIATRALDADLVSGLAAKLDTPGAWTAWTPTVTAASGSFTTVSATGAYCQMGKVVTLYAEVTITAVGTAAAEIIVSMPVAPKTGVIGYGAGRERAVTGAAASVYATDIGIQILNYANASLIGNGYIIGFQVTYEAN